MNNDHFPSPAGVASDQGANVAFGIAASQAPGGPPDRGIGAGSGTGMSPVPSTRSEGENRGTPGTASAPPARAAETAVGATHEDSSPRRSTTRIKLNPSFWRHSYCVPFSEDVVPSSLFLKHRHFLVIDIETKQLVQEVGGWDHVDKLGVSVACAYDSRTDQFLSYRENELKALFELCEERLVVGYNIRGFDLLVLAAYGLATQRLDVFDLMYDLETLTRQRYLKLDAVARGTLGETKSADGLQAVEWWKAGQVDKIIEYCTQDVKVTRDVFQFGRQNGYIKIQRSEERIVEVPVQWN